MAVVRPFRAVRPTPELAAKCAALPYDVMDTEEAKKYVEGNPYSFMRIDRAEMSFPVDHDPYAQDVYEEASKMLQQRKADGVYIQDEKPCYYIYKQVMNGRAQIGIVGCASVDDYMNNIVKKHELTLAKKEDDRCNHVEGEHEELRTSRPLCPLSLSPASPWSFPTILGLPRCPADTSSDLGFGYRSSRGPTPGSGEGPAEWG